MFQYIFSMVTETLVSLLIAGILWYERNTLKEKYIDGDDSRNEVSEITLNIIGGLILILVSLITITYFLIVSFISIDRVRSNKFKSYIGFMLERLQIDSRLRLLYNFWFSVRRIMICFVAIFLKDYTGI